MSKPFSELLVHKGTLHQLQRFLEAPSHGLVLTAPSGSGKYTLSLAIAAALLGINQSKLENYPYFSITNPKTSTITIDEIRSLQKLLTLRTPETGQQIRRVLLVQDAGRMRSEAQNAFLKSLEEPPADTVIIFTAEGVNDLLPTIYSRMRRIDVRPIDEASALNFYSQKGIRENAFKSSYALSQGQIGLMHSLLMEESHELKDWVERAKDLLKKPAAERLLEVDQLSKEKTDAFKLIGAFKRITHAALLAAGKANNKPTILKWQNGLLLSEKAATALFQNANTKLVLDNLLLNL